MTKFLGLAGELVFFSSSGFDKGTKQAILEEACSWEELHSPDPA